MLAAISGVRRARHCGARRSREPGIHFATRYAVGWIPGSRSARPGMTEPRSVSGAFVVSCRSLTYVRVRIRIMKLSKLNSATCIQASDSLR